MTDPDPDRERRPEPAVERRGRSPPSPAGLDDAVAELLADAEAVEDLYVVRLSLADGSDREVAERLLASLSDHLAVVGSTLSGWDPADPRLDVLVETHRDRDTVASGLADVGPVEGVVVGDVTVLAEDDADPARETLSIYRLDDHLVVTEDFGALVERFDEVLVDEAAREAASAVAEDVDVLREQLDAVGTRLDGLERHLDAVDGELASVADTAESAHSTAEGAHSTAEDARSTAEGARSTAEGAAATADEARSTTAEAREAVETLDDELDDVAAAVEGAADEAALAELSDHVESSVPTRLELEYVFAPAADRVDDGGRHPDMESVVEEVDRELRRSYRLREAGLLGRLQWLLTGELPGE
jgi:archaellum component FlaC